MNAQAERAALRAAHAHLLARRFSEARDAAAAWADGPAGALLYALGLAGSGAVDAAAPLLARIAAANPGADHPLLDLVPLLRPDAAVRHLRAGIRERPQDARLLGALGALLADIGPMEEAVALFRRAAELRPAHAASWSNLGKALSAQGAFPAAEDAFATARRLAPADPKIAYNQAVTLLKAGRPGGWAALRVRDDLPGRPQPLPGARLRSLDVAGRTVLLRHEEGFGDTLQFIRYAQPLAERGARVIAAVPAALVRIVAAAAGVAEAVSPAALPRYDLWVPLLDLPGLFADEARWRGPYLRAVGAAPAAGRRIGVVWAGDPNGWQDRIRSMPPEALAPLRHVPGVTWVSLQHGAPAPDWMLDPMPSVQDFADTAALIAPLEAVVSVDTAVAHLAGAMGKPVLLMDRYDHCWRWPWASEATPWYPAMRIVRQAAPGEWDGVVSRVAELMRRELPPTAR